MKAISMKKKLILVSVSLILAMTLAACNENSVSDVNLNEGAETNDTTGNLPTNDSGEGIDIGSGEDLGISVGEDAGDEPTTDTEAGVGDDMEDAEDAESTS